MRTVPGKSTRDTTLIGTNLDRPDHRVALDAPDLGRFARLPPEGQGVLLALFLSPYNGYTHDVRVQIWYRF